ncbi:ImmA/IrrE family metallo-endopeptidase [Metabacillus idriensis]|uniref:ImmA/IrrE family metallo-endopeptidase n=1 Tax=Metabacillus idriensis TaxID=324768 RepID=UPI003D2B7512
MNSREKALFRARQLMDDYFSFGGSFPVNMKMLASLAGITVREKYMEDDQSGKLLIQDGKLAAYVNIFDPPRRQNFTIAHEIAHTLMDEFDHIQYRKKESEQNEMERLCDEVASELLLPTDEFKRQMNQHGEKLSSFKPLTKFFHASLEAVAVKFAGCAANQKRTILMVTDFHAAGRRDLAISGVIPLEDWDIFVPKGLSIGKERQLADSFYQNAPFEETMQVGIGHVQGEYLVETYPSKFQKNGKLYNKGYIMLSK